MFESRLQLGNDSSKPCAGALLLTKTSHLENTQFAFWMIASCKPKFARVAVRVCVYRYFTEKQGRHCKIGSRVHKTTRSDSAFVDKLSKTVLGHSQDEGAVQWSNDGKQLLYRGFRKYFEPLIIQLLHEDGYGWQGNRSWQPFLMFHQTDVSHQPHRKVLNPLQVVNVGYQTRGVCFHCVFSSCIAGQGLLWIVWRTHSQHLYSSLRGWV